MHSGGVVPHEEGFVGFHRLADEALGLNHELVVEVLLALRPERALVFNRLASLAVGLAVDHAAPGEGFRYLWILGIIIFFGILAGVQVIKNAEERIEAVRGGQMFVPIAEVVLAELARGIAVRLQQLCNRWIFLLHPLRCTGETDGAEADAD